MHLLVGVQNLDGVLDRDDVPVAGAVDVVDHRGERRRLARAGGAGDQNQPARLVGEALDDLRQAELGDGGSLGRNATHGDPDTASLVKDVDPEAPHAADRVGEVEFVAVSNPWRCASVIIPSASSRVWSALSVGICSITTRRPASLMAGGLPTLICRSELPRSVMIFSRPSMSAIALPSPRALAFVCRTSLLYPHTEMAGL